MNIVILMAGDGMRFKEVGYPMPKPFVEVSGKYILEWTTSSIPSILHYTNYQNHKLFFAIRKEHDLKFEIERRIRKIYGNNVEIIKFDHLTRGGLETALLTCNNIFDGGEILFLDSDNYYNGALFEKFLADVKSKEKNDFGAICYFNPLDRSSKWCFAFTKENNEVYKLSEKDDTALDAGGKPMVGVFYFSNEQLFVEAAKKVIANNEIVKGEFYMSQAIVNLLNENKKVYGCLVDNVVPMGTPQDIMTARSILV